MPEICDIINETEYGPVSNLASVNLFSFMQKKTFSWPKCGNNGCECGAFEYSYSDCSRIDIRVSINASV